MLHHVSILGLGAAMLLAVPTRLDDAQFALAVSGGLRMTASGRAEFGALPATADVPAAFSITLGAESGTGALVLMQRVGTAPAPGRYRVSEWRSGGTPDFSAVFVAGSPAEPLGVFRGESGTITITATRPGRVEGKFRIEARGFLAAAPEKETVRVTLQGSFVAHADHAVATAQRMDVRSPM